MSFSGSLLGGSYLGGQDFYGNGLINPWSPSFLFARAEPGVWYDPSDVATLYQDTAGTQPVTTAGQSVALMLDKSGNGLNATQSITASRPTYQIDANGKPHLSFDGIDDFMVTPTITPGIDKAQVFAGVRKLTDASVGSIMELSAVGITVDGTIGVLAPNSATQPNYRTSSRGTVVTSVASPNNYAAPITAVLGVISNIATPLLTLRVNSAEVGASIATQGTGNYLAYPLYIGRRGGTSLPFNGNIYGMIVRFGANLSGGQVLAAERWLNNKTGAY